MLKMQNMNGKQVILKSRPGTPERNKELFGVLSGIAKHETSRKEVLEEMPEHVICGILLEIAQNWPGKPTEDWIKVIAVAAHFIHKTVGIDNYLECVLEKVRSPDSNSQNECPEGSPMVGTA